MSVLDGGFDPVHGRNKVMHPENYPPERPTPPAGMENHISCVVGGHWIPRDDAALDFGRDVWGQPHNRGYCADHAPWAVPGGMEPADELAPGR